MLLRLKLISVACLLLQIPLIATAHSLYPDTVGQRAMYETTIDLPEANISGILIMVRTDENNINASIVNEFGLSLMDFSYNEKREKIKLHNVMSKLNRWYIKRMLKNDLKQALKAMRKGDNEHYNKRHNIKYTFHSIDDAKE